MKSTYAGYFGDVIASPNYKHIQMYYTHTSTYL